ncbi:hypothetical protein G9298_29215 (plasmid) [Bacillus thuringiensis]|nr:hypothetical protein G9298_29215 [Bacillus thuringiensis]
MNIIAINPNQRKNKIVSELKGYWASNEWNADTFPMQDRKGKIRENKKSVDFAKIRSDSIRIEMKYYSFYSLTNEIWLLSNFIEVHFNKMYFLSKFLTEKHPRITSIIDIPYNELLDEYKVYLTQNNKSLKQSHPRGGEFISPYLSVFKNMYDFYSNY